MKTIVSILTIGAAIAINVIPGVGQVISGAIVGLGGGTFAALGVAQAVVGALTLGLTVAGIGAFGSLIGLGPSAPKPDTTETSIKTPRPPRVSAYGARRLYFAYSLYETSSGGTAIDVGAVHDGEMDGLISFYLNDDAVTLTGNTVNEGADGRYAGGAVHIYWTTGVTPGTPFASIVSLLPGIWTNDHRGDGIVMIAMTAESVKSKNFLDVYPSGAPLVSMAARWQKCPDPSAEDPTDESGWTWTENVIRQLLHYKLKRERVDYATKIAPTIDYWIAAADVCDEAVPLLAGGTEAKWRSCIAHKHTEPHKVVTGALLSACDGWIAPRADGALVVFAGKYMAPTVSIGPGQVVSFDWSGVGVDDDKAINEIVCAYVSAEHDYNTVDTTQWTDEADISERGDVLSDNLDPQVPSHAQVRRLAKRKMSRTNALHRGTVTTNVAGRIVRGQRYINLELTDAGTTFFNGVAEIVALTRNISSGGVTFSWVEADPNIDDWDPATEEGLPAASGPRVTLTPLTAPEVTGLAISNDDDSGDGSAGARIAIEATGPDRTDLTWFARWRVKDTEVWATEEYPDTDPGANVALLTSFVPVNNIIEVQIAYMVGDGRLSPWSTPSSEIDTSTQTMLEESGDAMLEEDGELMIEG